MTLTKPCMRRGCGRLIEAAFPCELKRRAYCSVRCAVLARIEAGWKPHAVLTRASRSLGGRRGGRLGGLVHRRRALERAVREVEPFLTSRFLEDLTPQQRAAVRALIARSYVKGRQIGYHSALTSRRVRAKRKAA